VRREREKELGDKRGAEVRRERERAGVRREELS
jgi:hypothetical protein